MVSNLVGAPLPTSTATISKATDAHGGSFAAQLETKSYTLAGRTAIVPGVLILGPRFSDFSSFYSGVPCTARPTQLQFYYKLTLPAGASDISAVSVSLTRTTNGVSTDLARTDQALAPAAAYTLVTIPLTYSSNAAPDSLHLEFYSSATRVATAGLLC